MLSHVPATLFTTKSITTRHARIYLNALKPVMLHSHHFFVNPCKVQPDIFCLRVEMNLTSTGFYLN